jgi:hypothetical protein
MIEAAPARVKENIRSGFYDGETKQLFRVRGGETQGE